jgi:monoamine oxidase
MTGCSDRVSIKTNIVGQNSTVGHRLRTMDFPQITETHRCDVAIVGGGVAGLSAARHLKKHSVDFMLLELQGHTGGNSFGGMNTTSAFPRGAHYLPLPRHDDVELISFLKDVGVIESFKDGLPVFNEYFLCFQPKERLFINNFWQDGLIPSEGVPKNDRSEIEKFLSLVEDFKKQKGSDGKFAFTIPVAESSQDEALLALDNISIAQFLKEKGFTSQYLRWYVNYCVLDDFGSTLEETSAWAALHYFSSRRGIGANASSDTVLTWPEGNYWLTKALEQDVRDKARTNAVVFAVKDNEHDVEVSYFDVARNVSVQLICKRTILAIPRFIAQRLLPGVSSEVKYKYAPWVVANITIDSPLNEKRGEGLCWDNVIYGSERLGYINAQHQQINQLSSDKKVITYYVPLASEREEQMRATAHQTTPDEWQHLILSDLKGPHPEIEKSVSDIEVWIWGHGMIKPVPGFIWNRERRKNMYMQGKRIYFAHSDLSGISIFEEAFHNGLKAAKTVLEHGII